MNNLAAQQKGVKAGQADLVNIGNMFGKVMQGQIGALSRVGITFTEAEEKILRYGNEQERASMLAQVIRNNVGEMNKALANTPAGRAQQLANSFGDLQEEIGRAITPLRDAFVPVLQRAVEFSFILARKLQTAFAVIAAVMNALFGNKQVEQAKAMAEGNSSAAGSIDDLGDAFTEAGKKAKRSVAGFDEVNNLTDQLGAGAGAVTGGLDGMSFGGGLPSIELPEIDISKYQGVIDAAVKVREAFLKLAEKLVDMKQRFEDASPAIKRVATILGITLMPLIISTGLEAAKAGLLLMSKFVAGIVQSGISAIVASVQIASKFIAEVIRTAIFAGQAAWSLSLMIAQFIIAGTKAVWTAIQIGISTTAMIAAKVAAVAFTGAQLALNLAVKAFPILALVAAFALLAKTFNDQYHEQEGFKNKWKAFTEDVKWTFIGMGMAISNTWKNFWLGLEDERGRRSGGFKDKWNEFWKGIGDGWTNFWGGITQGFKDTMNEITGFINKITSAWNDLKFDVPKVSLPDWMGGGSFGGNSIKVPQIKAIPKLANGGIVNGATTFMAGEAGAEAIVPLENSAFIEKFAEIISDMIGNNSKEVSISIDGTKLARAIIPTMQKENARIGSRAVIQMV